MPGLRSDPLLRITRLVLRIAMWIAGAAALLSAVMVPGIWVIRPEGLIESDTTPALALAASSILAVAMAVFSACAFQFLRHLIAIIDTVGRGSPFIPDNARRLRSMAWLVLGVQAVALAVTPATLWMVHHVPRFHPEVTFDMGGVILFLLLLILARVFDHGTRLAEDVEGTV